MKPDFPIPYIHLLCAFAVLDGVPQLPADDAPYQSPVVVEAGLAESEAFPRECFLNFIANQWPLDRLVEYCTEENRRRPDIQNLVAKNVILSEALYVGAGHSFDRIYVYVNAPPDQKWTYSLTVGKGHYYWAIIDTWPESSASKAGLSDNARRILKDLMRGANNAAHSDP